MLARAFRLAMPCPVRIFTVISVLFVFTLRAFAQATPTVGLLTYDERAADGYTLFAPLTSNITFLINNEGNLVHSWQGTARPGNSVYFLENGNLLRTEIVLNETMTAGGEGGKVIEQDWEGNIIWSFTYNNDKVRSHHDVEYLPNGNILMIAWEYKTYDEAIAAGRKPTMLSDNELWPDHVIEVDPSTNEIVWEWHVWNHLIQDYDPTKLNYGVVADHPGLINLNYKDGVEPNTGGADWNHTNGIDYNEEFDQILLSVHGFSEIWIIDHSTTTEEAAGHSGGIYGNGGDLLYRWGNPEAYDHGTANDQKLYQQHNAHWIEAGLSGEGNILIFNNGKGRLDGDYSSIEEITPPQINGAYPYTVGESYGPEGTEWNYSNPGTFFADHISGAQRQLNGNTLICEGTTGTFFEVTENGALVWEYVNPIAQSGALTQGDTPTQNSVFRAYRYSEDYPGFAGKDLTPGNPLEIYNTTVLESGEGLPTDFVLFQNFPNPFNPSTKISFALPNPGNVTVDIFNILGELVENLVSDFLLAGNYIFNWNAEELPSGIYLYSLEAAGYREIKKMTLMK
ncbi:MAG: aryl-sulfate sulfotransferase [Bacteroidetes bacterium]|nr:aryl-sulfate sulfotransferase [Bacteroidota bacterium]